MYSIVLMMALQGGAEVPGWHRSFGCYGGAIGLAASALICDRHETPRRISEALLFHRHPPGLLSPHGVHNNC